MSGPTGRASPRNHFSHLIPASREHRQDDPKPRPRRLRFRGGTIGFRLVLAVALSAASLWAGRIWGRNEWVWSSLPAQDFEMVFRQNHFPSGAILSGPPDPNYVCHDWTFFGGAIDARCENVEQYLQDAGYVEVTDPQVGDVIVYRDASNQCIVHSGL